MMDVMRRLAKRALAERGEGDGQLVSLLFLSAFFFLGLLGGLLFAALGEASPELSDYLGAYFQVAGTEGGWSPSPWSAVWELIRWPVAALALGFTTLGVFCVPALLLARGFLLSYSVCLFLRLFGVGGLLAALVVFGVTALFALPVLFAVGCESFRACLGRLGRYGEPARPSLRQYLATLVPSAGMIVAGAVAQCTLMPALLDAVCARFFVS